MVDNLESDDELDNDICNDSDLSDEEIENDNHDSLAEQSASVEKQEEAYFHRKFYVGKDEITKWSYILTFTFIFYKHFIIYYINIIYLILSYKSDFQNKMETEKQVLITGFNKFLLHHFGGYVNYQPKLFGWLVRDLEINTNKQNELNEEMEKFFKEKIEVETKIKTMYKMGPKTYLVKLENIQEKTEIMKNKVKLGRYKDDKVYINNDMTRQERDTVK
ncbi:hypothetical protein FQA39_LY15580 [Lamprigera yunnana]|nr:hypothetical protein FQA39_LY15580 [Lamprigera yunnana]